MLMFSLLIEIETFDCCRKVSCAWDKYSNAGLLSHKTSDDILLEE